MVTKLQSETVQATVTLQAYQHLQQISIRQKIISVYTSREPKGHSEQFNYYRHVKEKYKGENTKNEQSVCDGMNVCK